MKREKQMSKELTLDYSIYLHNIHSPYITMGVKDDSYVDMKIRTQHIDGVKIDMNRIHIDLLNTYIECGLGKNNDKKIVVGEISISPHINSTIIVSYKYE